LTLARRLRVRIPEIEAAILARVQAVAPVDRNADPEYVHGLNTAIRAAIDHTVATIEVDRRLAPPIPPALLGQARLAAHHGVNLGTVLRRYSLGANQLSDFVVDEAEHDNALRGGPLRLLLREQTLSLEKILAEFEYEYGRERQDRPVTRDSHLAALVQRLLSGEPADTSELNYDFDGHHIGIVTESERAPALLRDLARAVDGRLLSVRPSPAVTWAWIGTRYRIDPTQLLRPSVNRGSPHARLALGEPESGSLGWRRTHLQARDAFPYVVRTHGFAARYADIALQAAIERDDVASTSLRQLYVAPFADRPDGGVLVSTLRAYFAAGRNAAAAAATLEVSRQTVSKRLHSVEAVLKRPLYVCAADLEIALRLADMH
jgi:PucR C-terminal helix-turn-helix domain